MNNDKRTDAWKRNESLEELLSELSELMAPAQALCSERDRGAPALPIVLVVGAPRSGTTLMMQSIAASGLCAYPTNVLGRFYAAPGVGARIQRLLFDPAFRFRDEFDDLQPEPPGFRSKLGKTQGALAPNEFWYFWRRFLPHTEIEPMGHRLGDVNMEGLRTELHSITTAFGRPFAAKGMMLQYDMEAFARAIPDLLFLHVERDTAANASSLLDARQSFFGSEAQWYSAKPPGYAELETLTPVEQVVGQVEWTNRAIHASAAALPPERTLHVRYEDFCSDPAAAHTALRASLVALEPNLAESLPDAYTGPAAFIPSRALRATASDGAQPGTQTSAQTSAQAGAQVGDDRSIAIQNALAKLRR